MSMYWRGHSPLYVTISLVKVLQITAEHIESLVEVGEGGVEPPTLIFLIFDSYL